ncbi:unnamed protein product [Heterobilharzia americana]|nr:unnamed protein product [Heterobilharzia americana]
MGVNISRSLGKFVLNPIPTTSDTISRRKHVKCKANDNIQQSDINKNQLELHSLVNEDNHNHNDVDDEK